MARYSPHSVIFDVSNLFNYRVDACTAPTMTSRVCVIGAGVSGLRCATVLLEHGVEVVMIEARDRIGGRVWIRPIEAKNFRLILCRLLSLMKWVQWKLICRFFVKPFPFTPRLTRHIVGRIGFIGR